MKTPRAIVMIATVLLTASPAWSASKPAVSDVVAPPKRQQTVDVATRLTRQPAPVPVGADLLSPFNPPNFEQPDPEELKANAAAGIRAAGQAGPGGPVAPAKPAGPVGDRELLEVIAARIQPTGSVNIRGKPLLTFPGKTVGVGQSFLVTYNGQDHELELIAVERTTFTVRLRGEEITRPIKPTK